MQAGESASVGPARPRRNAAKNHAFLARRLSDSESDDYESPVKTRKRKSSYKGRGSGIGGESISAPIKSSTKLSSSASAVERKAVSISAKSMAVVDLTLDSPTPSPPSSPRSKKRESLPGILKPSLPAEKWRGLDMDNAYVWVLLSEEGRVYGLSDEGNDSDYIWWPSKVKKQNGQRIVVESFCRFGKQEFDFSVDNILPFTSSSRVLFDEPTYVTPTKQSTRSSPRKKMKRDRLELERDWDRGTIRALKGFSADVWDELPPNFVLQHRLYPQEGSSESISDDEASSEVIEPPQPVKPKKNGVVDEDVKIPGEGVLGRSTNNIYWPALIKGYNPSTDRYEVMWMTGKRGFLRRSQFYIMTEAGFNTCKVGEFKTEWRNGTKDEDEGEGELIGSKERSPSPEVDEPNPSVEDFVDMSLRQQLAYIKPVLIAIILKEYAPAELRHMRFVNGGKDRELVKKDAGSRGSMFPQEVEELGRLVSDWALRGEKYAQRDPGGKEGSDGGDGCSTVIDEGEGAGRLGNSASFVSDATLDVPSSPVDDVLMQSPKKEVKAPQYSSSESSPAKKSPGQVMDSNDLNEDSHREPSPEDVPPPSSSFPQSELSTNGATSDSMNRQTSALDILASAASMSMDAQRSREGEGDDHPSGTNADASKRLVGCESYERLSRIERVEYVNNVLLPEAVLQILLWRKGKRHSTDLLSLDEEKALHVEGQKLLDERNWVSGIMFVRQQAESYSARKAARKEKKGGSESSIRVGGTNSRPKFL